MCDNYVIAGYYGDSDYLFCQCACNTGIFPENPAKKECCDAFSKRCDIFQVCHVNTNYVADCEDISLRVGYALEVDATNKQSRNEQLAAAVAGILAVQHFNERAEQYNSGIGNILQCKRSISVVNAAQSERNPLSSVKAAISVMDSNPHVVFGPSSAKAVAATLPVSSGFGTMQVPNANYIAEDSMSSKTNTLVAPQGQLDLSAIATCQFLDNELGYDHILVFQVAGDTYGEAMAKMLTEACSSENLELTSFILPFSDDAGGDMSQYMAPLLKANATGVNVVLYLGRDDPTFQIFLQSSFEIGLLRPQTVWMFFQEDIVNSAMQLPLSIRRLLHGSMLVLPLGARRGNLYYERFLDDWPSFEVSKVNPHLPADLQLPENFFRSFNPRNSLLLETQGALLYDMVMYLGLLSCALFPSEEMIPKFAPMRSLLLSQFSKLNFTGFTGSVQFPEGSLTRDSDSLEIGIFNILPFEDAFAPSSAPTASPTQSPSVSPTEAPTRSPSPPSVAPTSSPTDAPTVSTLMPTPSPTNAPTDSPTANPSMSPSHSPTEAPTVTKNPSSSPSQSPSHRPTMFTSTNPTQAPVPTSAPTYSPPSGFYASLRMSWNATRKEFAAHDALPLYYNGGSTERPANSVQRPKTLLKVGILHTFSELIKANSSEACTSRSLTIGTSDAEVKRRICVLESQPEVVKLGILSAMLLAVQHFNQRKLDHVGLSNLTCNKQIELSVYDTFMDSELAIEQTLKLIEQEGVDVLVGPEELNELVSSGILSSIYKVPQFAFAARTDKLNDELHQSIFRVTSSHASLFEAVCFFWSQLGFRYAAVLVPENSHGEMLQVQVEEACKARKIEVLTLKYSTSEEGATSGMQKVFHKLVDSGLTIVLFCGTEETDDEHASVFKQVMVSAYESGALRSGTSWSFVDWYIPSFIEKAGLSEDIQKTLSGSFLFSDLNETSSALNSEAWGAMNLSSLFSPFDLYNSLLQPGIAQSLQTNASQSRAFKSIAHFAYDAILLAGTLACLVSPEDVIEPAKLLEDMKLVKGEVQFNGVSGRVGMKASMSRSAPVFAKNLMLTQAIDGWEEITRAQFEDSGVGWEGDKRSFRFNGGLDTVPLDKVTRRPELLKVALFYAVSDDTKKSEESCQDPFTWMDATEEQNLYVGKCLLPWTSQKPLLAALLAINHFNSRNPVLVESLENLQGTCNKLMDWTLYDAGRTTVNALATFNRVQIEENDLVLGPEDDNTSVATGLVAGVFGIPQISSGARSLEMKDKEKFPTFSRVVPSDELVATPVCAFLKASRFAHVAVLHVDNEYGRGVLTTLVEECAPTRVENFLSNSDELDGVKLHFMAFPENLAEKTNNQNRVLNDLQDLALNVVVVVSKSGEDVLTLVEAAKKRELIGEGSLWIFYDRQAAEYLQTQASKSLYLVLAGSMVFAAESSIGSNRNVVDFFSAHAEEKLSSFDLGLDTAIPGVQRLVDDLPVSFLQDDEAFFHYDAVMTAGLAACGEFPFAPIDESVFGERFQSQVQSKVKFTGLTGLISFDENGDRELDTVPVSLFNLVLKQNGLDFARVAVYDPELNQLVSSCDGCHPVLYNGNTTEMPTYTDFPEESRGYSMTVKGLCWGMFTFSFVLATFCLVWTRKNKNHYVIRGSQTLFLNMVTVGTMISTLTIIPLTLDDQFGPRAGPLGGNVLADFACNLSVWLYCFGFVLSFTTLFAKLRRLHIVMTMKVQKNLPQKKHMEKITDGFLAKLIARFVIVDVLILLLWTLLAPYEFRRVNLEEDRYGNPKTSSGSCVAVADNTAFLGAILLFHVSVLLYGLWISHKCRNYNSSLSEARYVTIAIFSNLQVLLLAVPVLMVVQDDPSTNMFVRCGIIFLNDVGVELMLFIPKFYFVSISPTAIMPSSAGHNAATSIAASTFADQLFAIENAQSGAASFGGSE